MKWTIFFFTVIYFFAIGQFASADTNSLSAKIEHNQLDSTFTNATQCSQQPIYAQAISHILSGYNISTILNGTTQNARLGTKIHQASGSLETKGTIKDVLANHDLAIIIDRSGSMATQDCPGGLSRWQWCNNQASDLAQAAQQVSSSITLIFFNNDLQIFDKLNPKTLPLLFSNYLPSGGTILSTPLIAQLDKYFSSRAKPLIIVVITDGLPQDCRSLPAIISDATDSLHYAGEVTISFLLINSQIKARQFSALLGEYDTRNIMRGGMVDVIGFKDLRARGVKQTLYEELRTIHLNTNKNQASIAAKYSTVKCLNPYTKPVLTHPASFSLNPFPTRSLPSQLN